MKFLSFSLFSIMIAIASSPVGAIELDLDYTSSGTVLPMGDAPVDLVVDDGTSENTIGDSGQFIWFNRFTPNPTDFPFQIEEIEVEFGTTLVTAGDAIELLVYSDTDGDGDPGTGTVLLAQFSDTVQTAGALNSYTLATPVRIDGPGEVIIGVINRAGSEGFDDFPAALDQTASAGRSWAGTWLSGDAPATPTFPADEQWGTIDSFGFPGNWIVRAFGSGIIDTPFSVSQTDATPTSLPVTDPAYAPDGAFDIEIVDGSCTGTYDVDVTPVVGSAPDGSTPPAPVPDTYTGVGESTLSFASAGAGDYDVLVTEVGGCGLDPGDNPVTEVASVGSLEPGLEATPDAVDFGDQAVGVASAATTLTLNNNGTASVTVTALTGLNPPFQQVGGDCGPVPFVIAAAGQCTIDVNYLPTTTGADATNLELTSTAPDSPEIVSLIGNGVQAGLSLSTTTLNLGPISANATAEGDIELQNTGDAPLDITAIGDPGAPFSISGDCLPTPVTLAPGESCILTILFSPSGSTGTFDATLDITSSAPSSPDTVSISGSSQQAFAVPVGQWPALLALILLMLVMAPWALHRFRPS